MLGVGGPDLHLRPEESGIVQSRGEDADQPTGMLGVLGSAKR
jgi:hypothetical protein